MLIYRKALNISSLSVIGIFYLRSVCLCNYKKVCGTVKDVTLILSTKTFIVTHNLVAYILQLHIMLPIEDSLLRS